jgi:L-ascorbate oxidase
MQQKFRWMGDPQSILHNGKGNYSCPPVANAPSLAQFKCTPQTAEQALAAIKVEPGKTYLLRVISTTTLSFLDLAIEGHNMTVVEADGAFTHRARSTVV